MMTYMSLALFMLVLAWVVAQKLNQPLSPSVLLRSAIVLYLAMAVFNTYLTILPIVQYDTTKILGVKILTWPIEDMAYLVVALYVGPALYSRLLRHYASSSKTSPTHRSSNSPVVSQSKLADKRPGRRARNPSR